MTLFTTVDPRPIHFMGIAGAGMSGLALLAKEQGVTLTGCDNDPTGAADLAALGVEIWRGYNPAARTGARGLLVASVGTRDNPVPAPWNPPRLPRARRGLQPHPAPAPAPRGRPAR